MDFSRQEQLDQVLAELKRHAELGRLITAAKRTHAAQVSHLEGVYSEVDKLTKGKSLVPTSDLLVEVVNSLIFDAKGLMHRDTYLDRLKTFVPAGDNPAYPDVLVALRILQQTLSRFDSMLDSESADHGEVGEQLPTILAVLQVAEEDERKFYHDNSPDEDGSNEEDDSNAEGQVEEADDDDEEDEDEGSEDEDEEDDEEDDEDLNDDADDSENDDSDAYEEQVWKSELRAKLDRKDVSAAWFRTHREGDSYFDFKRLDAIGIPRYTPPAEGITFMPGND